MVRSSRGMASAGNQEQQEEMTVVVLRLKGSPDTLRKGFDTLTTAFSTMGVAAPTTKYINGGTQPQLNQQTVSDVDEQETPGHTEESAESNTGDPTHASKSHGSTPRKPTFLSDFDLNSANPRWTDFANSKSLKSDSDKYLLAALWITENANLPEFNVNQIFTCFRAMQWSEQVDFSQPIRQMKSKRSYFSHPSPKTWKLTQPGLEAARAIQDLDQA